MHADSAPVLDDTVHLTTLPAPPALTTHAYDDGGTVTVATCTAGALVSALVTTMAVSTPAEGAAVSVSVSCVAVALATTAVPLLSVTTLSVGVVLKPVPVKRGEKGGASASQFFSWAEKRHPLALSFACR